MSVIIYVAYSKDLSLPVNARESFRGYSKDLSLWDLPFEVVGFVMLQGRRIYPFTFLNKSEQIPFETKIKYVYLHVSTMDKKHAHKLRNFLQRAVNAWYFDIAICAE